MMARCGHRQCSNPSAIEHYIDKGIVVCEPWHDFSVFSEWASGHGYADDLTIDRIDAGKNYDPHNCRWISMKENLRARADRKLSMDDAREIRRLYARGVAGDEIAERFQITRNYVYRVASGERWAE